jgi:hypothetical protein
VAPISGELEMKWVTDAKVREISKAFKVDVEEQVLVESDAAE